MQATHLPPDLPLAISVHHGSYQETLLEILKEYGFGRFVSTDINDANNGRLNVSGGVAYIAVVGYESLPVPSYNNPNGRFLTEIELDEAFRLRRPFLVLFREEAPAPKSVLTTDKKKQRILKRATELFDPSMGRFHVTFEGPRDFREKASAAVGKLHAYLLQNVPQNTSEDAGEVDLNIASSSSATTKSQTRPAQTTIRSLRLQKGDLVLKLARDLALKSNRAGVTSSCILFALAELASHRTDTCSFLRKSLEDTAKYKEEFDKFLSVSGSPPAQAVKEVAGIEGKVSRNAEALINNAVDIALRVSGSAEISHRHIFAALIAVPGTPFPPHARRRLTDLGIDIEKLSSDFLDFLRSRNDIPSDDFARWAAILTPKTFQHGPAGYNSEFVGMGGRRQLEDSLDVKDWANQLADLIALRETKLPLAIGLFGNWGSGKSHFMNLMDQKLKSKTDEAKREGTSDRWCTEIVPVYFNAWHYLDSNLWASLVSQIFESLFIHLRPRTDELQKMQELLEEASGATARAAEEVKVAEGVTKQAREELVLAEQSRRTQETFVDGLLHGLKSLLPEVDQKTIQDHAAELLGVEKEIKTIDDLRGVVNEGRSFTTRAVAVAKKLWQQPWRLGFMAAAVVGAALIAYVLVPQIPWLKDQLEGTGRRVAALLGALAAFVTWVRPIFAAVGRQLNQLETWTRHAETAQQNARESETVKAATIRVDAAAAKEQDAQTRYQEARAREESLKAQALNLRPERRLGRFIEERSQSLDYRGQLGLISLARRDFQELSDIFADKEALDKRVAAAENEKDKALIETLSAAIDRIVLFVDDLDRCQPEKVVDVLQAVHLLLAFPLFAVVVGVDQRCLKQSLRMQMKGLLTDELSENGATPKPDPDADENGRPATPLDYLEKIFHVPFHLPQMGETGFKKLIDRLTEPVAATTPTRREEIKPQEDQPPQPIVNNEADIKVNISEAQPDSQTPTDPAAGNGSKIAPSDHMKQTHDGDAPPRDPESIIGSVPLQRWEREALRAYHPLIQTPRGATRLLNTYRLVRASVPKSEWEAFSGDKMSDGEFRIAMLLLAAAAGYPAQARQWFDRLLTTPASEVFSADALPENDPAWMKFKEVYDATFGYLVKPIEADVMSKWIHRVERFAF